MYWTNLNPSLNRFSARVRIADKRFYTSYPIRIRFYPICHFRFFWGNRSKFVNLTWPEYRKTLSTYEKELLVKYISWARYPVPMPKTLKNREFQHTFTLCKWLMENFEKPKIRVESNTVDFYVTDPQAFTPLEMIGSLVWEIDLVNPNLAINEIECDNFPLDKYEYRVILKEVKLKNDNILNVIDELNSQGDIKITDRRLSDFKKFRNSHGDWLYVKDDYTLTIVNLAFGHLISRVLKYIKVKKEIK